MKQGVLKWLSREWSIILAFLAVISLFLIIPYIPTEARLSAIERQELDGINTLFREGRLQETKNGLESFARRHPGSPLLGEVNFLLASAILNLARDKFSLSKAWQILAYLEEARRLGMGDNKIDSVLYEVACLLRENDELKDAISIYSTLRERMGDKILLDIALTYSMFKDVLGEEFLPTALGYIEEFLLKAKGKEITDGYLLKAEILKRHKRFSAALDTLNFAEDKGVSPKFYIERAKLNIKLQKIDNASSDLQKVLEVGNSQEKDIATYFLGTICIIKNDPEAIQFFNKLIGSPILSGLPILCKGKFQLSEHSEEAFENILAGLKLVKKPVTFEEFDFNVDEFYLLLKRLWEGTEESETLLKYPVILQEFSRLYPNEPRYLEDCAKIYAKIAKDYKRKSLEVKKIGNLATYLELGQKVDNFYSKSGEYFLRITILPDIREDVKANAFKSAADVFLEGGYYLRASENYHTFGEYFPSDQSIVFQEAVSLKMAKLYERALNVFERCIEQFKKDSPYTAKAVVEKAKILLDLGKCQDAVSTVDMILKDESMEYGLAPTDFIWRYALFLKGLAHFEMARVAKTEPQTDERKVSNLFTQSRGIFTEFLKRYGEDINCDSRILAAFYIARTYTDEKRWKDALDFYKKSIRFAEKREEFLGDEEKEVLKQTHFYIGDIYFIVGDYKDALEAYTIGYRKYIADKDRIWGLVGISKTYLKMGQEEQAKLWLENAKNTFSENEKVYIEAPRGFGANFWKKMISEIEEKLPR
jgi:tetratricopeptide (TPR) repeat protein